MKFLAHLVAILSMSLFSIATYGQESSGSEGRLFGSYKVGPVFTFGSEPSFDGLTISTPIDPTTGAPADLQIVGTTCADTPNHLIMRGDNPNYKEILAQVMLAVATRRPMVFSLSATDCIEAWWSNIGVITGVTVLSEPAP